MRTIRAELRSQGNLPDLSVPQFRVLTYLNRHHQSSLSAAAEHIGLTLPSMSKMVDGLVARGLVTRVTSLEDRRRLNLALTAAGKELLDSAFTYTEKRLAERFAALSDEELSTIASAMLTMQSVFSSEQMVKIP
ncbi:MAG: MarR family transcriptional regulator [Chloroflexi bacterium]|nr:MarR family transcriptional regulator [Chloroflexota bacterium]